MRQIANLLRGTIPPPRVQIPPSPPFLAVAALLVVAAGCVAPMQAPPPLPPDPGTPVGDTDEALLERASAARTDASTDGS